MQMAAIIDLILVAVLVLCTVLGFRRGAFKSVIGIVVLIAALLGAGIVSSQAGPGVAKMVSPMLSQQIELRLSEYVQSALPGGEEATQESAEGMFSAMGLYQKTAEKLAGDVLEEARETGQTIVQAAVDGMVESIVSAVLFVLAFLVLLIGFTILSKFLGLLTEVPGIHLMNAALGGVLGLLQGCLILFVLVWAAQFFGSGVPESLLQETTVFRHFAALNPLSLVFGL